MRRTVATAIGLASFGPMTVAIVTFFVWFDANGHWLFPRWVSARRRWPESPLDETWVWVTALAIGIVLILISNRMMPKYWEYRRNALNSPIDDEAHTLHADQVRAEAPPRARHSP